MRADIQMYTGSQVSCINRSLLVNLFSISVLQMHRFRHYLISVVSTEMSPCQGLISSEMVGVAVLEATQMCAIIIYI